MLQWLRDNLKSFAWTLWVVIAAFILLYIPDFIGQKSLSSDTVASVGKREVTNNEFQRAYKQQEATYRQAFGDNFSPELVRQLGLYRQVLQQLIGRKILAREADRLGLAVSDEEVRKAILEIPAFRDESGRFIGDALYQRILRGSDYQTVGEFETAVREDLLVGKLRDVLAANVYIPDAQVEERYRREVEKASIRFIQLPASEFASEVKVSDDEIASYYEARREEYRRPEQRVVSYLLVDTALLRSTLEIPEADLRAFYEDNLDQYTTPEQVRARHILLKVDDNRSEEEADAQIAIIRQRLAAGEDFAALARQLSEDTGSAAQGGDLGFFGRGAMVPEFEEAAFSATAGEVVGPVRSSFGVHLLEVMERREGGVRPFEEVRAQIRFRLQGERAQGMAESRARELAGRIASEDIKTREGLQSLASATEGISFETTPPFGKGDPAGAMGRVQAFNDAAFALAAGGVSAEPVGVPRGWALLHLDEVREPRLPELTEVETEVRQAVARQKQEERVKEVLTAAREEIASGARSLDEVAEGLGLTVQDSGSFGYGQPIASLGQAPAVNQAALAMQQGEIGGPVETGVGAVLFEVTQRQSWDPDTFETAREQKRQELKDEEIGRLVNSITAEALRDPDVITNQEYLNRLEGNPPPA